MAHMKWRASGSDTERIETGIMSSAATVQGDNGGHASASEGD